MQRETRKILREVNSWEKVRGIWKDKKIDSLKHQQKIRQEWK